MSGEHLLEISRSSAMAMSSSSPQIVWQHSAACAWRTKCARSELMLYASIRQKVRQLFRRNNHQLKCMGDVYAHAQRVLIWLNKGDNQVADLMIQLSQNEQTALWPAALAAVISNEWFNPSWTLQELCYAKSAVMMYDQYQLSWETFIDRFDWDGRELFSIVEWKAWSSYTATAHFRALFRSLSHPPEVPVEPHEPGNVGPLHSLLLHIIRGRTSTRPEDPIYAFYQMLTDLRFPLPDPSVTRSVTGLLEETMLSLVEQSNPLKMLEYLPSQPRMFNLPSWVPHFSQPAIVATRSYYRHPDVQLLPRP